MTIRTVALCATLMMLTACKSEMQVTGDVFVATRGGQTYKLALVNVRAFAEEDVRKATTAQAQRANASVIRMPALLDSLTKQATAATARLAALGDAPGSSANLNVWKLSYTSPAFPMVGDKSRWNAWRLAYLDSLFLATRISQAQANPDSVVASMMASIVDAFPPPVATAKSDADGEFVLTLERGKRYALHAEATRAVFNNTEQYEWLIWVTPSNDGARVILANDNMVDTAAGREAKFQIEQWMQMEMKMSAK